MVFWKMDHNNKIKVSFNIFIKCFIKITVLITENKQTKEYSQYNKKFGKQVI